MRPALSERPSECWWQIVLVLWAVPLICGCVPVDSQHEDLRAFIAKTRRMAETQASQQVAVAIEDEIQTTREQYDAGDLHNPFEPLSSSSGFNGGETLPCQMAARNLTMVGNITKGDVSWLLFEAPEGQLHLIQQGEAECPGRPVAHRLPE